VIVVLTVASGHVLLRRDNEDSAASVLLVGLIVVGQLALAAYCLRREGQRMGADL
jgi:hypothetical protein